MPKKVMSNTIAALDQLDNQSLRMEREGGVYNFKLWVPRPSEGILNKNRFGPLKDVEEVKIFI